MSTSDAYRDTCVRAVWASTAATALETRAQKLFSALHEDERRNTRALFSAEGTHTAEALVVAALQQADVLIPRYRGVAPLLAKGVAPRAILAEYLKMPTGLACGRGDVCAFPDAAHRVIAGSPTLGSMFSVAIGNSMAVRDTGNCACVLFGDGEATRSTFLPVCNIAAVHQLPTVFLCVNNGYTQHTRTRDIHATSLKRLATAYAIAYLHVPTQPSEEHVTGVLHLVREVRTGTPALIEIDATATRAEATTTAQTLEHFIDAVSSHIVSSSALKKVSSDAVAAVDAAAADMPATPHAYTARASQQFYSR